MIKEKKYLKYINGIIPNSIINRRINLYMLKKKLNIIIPH